MSFVYDLGECYFITADADARTGRVENFQLEFRGGGTSCEVISSLPRAQVEALQLAITVFLSEEMCGEAP